MPSPSSFPPSWSPESAATGRERSGVEAARCALCSVIQHPGSSALVAERFSFHQHELDPRLGFLLAAQRQERLQLHVEELLLRAPGPRRDVPAREDEGDLPADLLVVPADLPRRLHRVEPVGERRERRPPGPPRGPLPAGAAATGRSESRRRMQASWNALTIFPMLSNCLFCASRKTIIRFAPAQKCSAWFAMTIPANSFSARSTPSDIMATMSASTVFILVWNSRHRTPSPMS